MSNVIDHAINIPVTQASLWSLVSDPEQNPRWHTGCKSVTYLNSIRRKAGARWRYTDVQGRSYVVEVTAWYEGYGYEYVLIDGTPFSENRGRIRLQETPDATTLQWTFSYSIKGLGGGIRSTLGLKRRLDEEIVASLKNLYRLRDTLTPIKESKSLMRSGPDANERAIYRSRYSLSLDEKLAQEGKAQTAPVLEVTPASDTASLHQEPPIAQDDTPPNPSLKVAVEIPPLNVANPQEPSFLAGLSAEPPIATDDTPRPAPAVRETPLAPSPIAEPPIATDDTPRPAPAVRETPLAPSPIAEPPIATDDTRRPAPAVREVPATPELPAHNKRDTATISVFDVFNVPPPSASQEMRAISLTTNAKDTQETAAVIADVNPYEMPRAGLRRYLRRKLYRLRLPF